MPYSDGVDTAPSSTIPAGEHTPQQSAPQYERHRLSAVFGTVSDEDMQDLVEDVRLNGVRDPITLYEGKVLDGWHRYQASVKAGVPCPSEDFPDDGDAIAFVISRNIHRRHLTPGERAMAVLRAATGGGDKCHPSMTNAEMAKAAGVPVRTIQRAKAKVRDEELKEVKEWRRMLEEIRDLKENGASRVEAVNKQFRVMSGKACESLGASIWVRHESFRQHGTRDTWVLEAAVMDLVLWSCAARSRYWVGQIQEELKRKWGGTPGWEWLDEVEVLSGEKETHEVERRADALWRGEGCSWGQWMGAEESEPPNSRWVEDDWKELRGYVRNQGRLDRGAQEALSGGDK